MGYTTRPGPFGHTSKHFRPDDTSYCFYIEVSADLDDIFGKAKERFGEDVKLSELRIEAEYIHTDFIDYDLFDSSDWTNYLCITLNKD
jgi:hypothetical protein